MQLRIDKFGPASWEAFSPLRTYHLSLGLTLEFTRADLIVRGGPSLFKSYALDPVLNEDAWMTPLDSSAMVNRVQQEIGVKVMGVSQPNLNYLRTLLETEQLPDVTSQVLPPAEILFRVDTSVITGGWLAEELLAKLTFLESLIRKLMRSEGVSEDSLHSAREICAWWQDLIWAGKLGPDHLNVLVREAERNGLPVKEAFFVFNAQSIAEDMRSSILRACHHFVNLTSGVWSINQSRPVQLSSDSDSEGPGETVRFSGEVDLLSYEFTSAVIACYSSLDMLYELFIYLTREPFGNPRFPTNLHFPDANSRVVFRNGGKDSPDDPSYEVLPYAIPNLSSGHFGNLRQSRNDLAHNMASDGHRPRVHIGVGLPPVKNYFLQYAQYLTRDIAADGKPITHQWSRRFYENQLDAQEVLYEWITQSWQCIIDTTEWLTHRLERRVSR